MESSIMMYYSYENIFWHGGHMMYVHLLVANIVSTNKRYGLLLLCKQNMFFSYFSHVDDKMRCFL